MSAANFCTMRDFPLFAKDYYEDAKRCPECGAILSADDTECEFCEFRRSNADLREKYLVATKTEEYTGLPAKDIWWQMIQLLPSSYNQKRTVMLNYEVLANIYKSRRHHKLDEWHTLCDRIESLPYSKLITGGVVDE